MRNRVLEIKEAYLGIDYEVEKPEPEVGFKGGVYIYKIVTDDDITPLLEDKDTLSNIHEKLREIEL